MIKMKSKRGTKNEEKNERNLQQWFKWDRCHCDNVHAQIFFVPLKNNTASPKSSTDIFSGVFNYLAKLHQM